MRRTLRVWFIVFATALAMLVIAPDLALPWHPWSSFGFRANQNGQVTTVDEQSARTGLRVGDTIDTAQLTPSDRARLVEIFPMAPRGDVLHLPLTSGRSLTLVSHPYSRTFAENLTDVVQILGLLLYAVLAAALVLLRPMPSTWAFYVFSYSCIISGSGTLFATMAPPTLLVGILLLTNVMQLAGAIAFVIFAMRFPDTPLSAGARRAERVLLYAAAPLLAGSALASQMAYVFFGLLSPQWTSTLYQGAAIALFSVGAVVLLYRYARADDETRARLQWVVAAFSVAYLPYLLIPRILGALPGAGYGGILVGNITSTISIIAPIALAYTVLKHRLFDIRLVVSRALIFGSLMTIVAGIIALADWGFGVWLAESKFALAAEAALALALGFSLTTLHRRIETTLNTVIFRRQTAALQALRRFTHEVDLIADPQRLLSQTYEALLEQFEIEYAALYAAEGSSFVRACGSEPAPALLPSDDFAVLRLRRWFEPFECEGAHHPLRGALLLPMTARTELVGFIVCGPKRDHTHYLPEEVETLCALAHRAGSAYAWLTVRPEIAIATRYAGSGAGMATASP